VSDALRDTGQLADTLFVFTTDHGVALPHMKCTLFEDGTGISLIARFPDGTDVSRGVAEDALVSNIDLFPTICDLLDTDRPDWLEGSSLLPLVSGTVDSVRDEVFGEVTYHAAYEPKRCIRTQDYTYIRRYDDGEGVDDWHPDGRVPYIPANTDDGEAKQALVEDLIERGRPREALYDRRLDPNERDDLADVAEYSDVRENLATRLDAWMRETDDPLLDGPVPKPDGARVDRRDVLQPGGDEAEEQNVR
jgi:arylsulfatase A-like enzyme